MNADIVKIFDEPAVKARFAVIGVLASGSTPEELAAKARADTELRAPIIKAANIRALPLISLAEARVIIDGAVAFTRDQNLNMARSL